MAAPKVHLALKLERLSGRAGSAELRDRQQVLRLPRRVPEVLDECRLCLVPGRVLRGARAWLADITEPVLVSRLCISRI